MSDDHDGESVAEKWIRNFAGAAMLLMVGWIGTSMMNLASAVSKMEQQTARIDAEVMNLREDMGRVQTRMNRIYTEEDAARDFRLRDSKMVDLNERIRALETQVFGGGR